MNSEEADEKMIDNLDDLNNEYPELLETVQKFFRVYWTPTGKPENLFAYNGEVQEKSLALDVIRFTQIAKAAQSFTFTFSYTHMAWREMINNCSISGEKFNTGNTLQGTVCTIDMDTGRTEVDGQVRQ
jgi:hypothetical protein